MVTFGKLLYTVVLKDSVVLKNPKSKGGEGEEWEIAIILSTVKYIFKKWILSLNENNWLIPLSMFWYNINVGIYLMDMICSYNIKEVAIFDAS